METDFGGAAPGWVLGQQGFDFLADGRLVAQYQKDGKSVLIVASVTGDGAATDIKEYGMDDGLPMKFGGVVGNDNNELFFLGGSPSTPSSVYKWSLDGKAPAQILGCSSTLSFPDDAISIPKQIEFPTTLGTAYGYYYPPKNGGFQCTSEEAPPLLVKAHGGPTACTGTSFSPSIQFWTSRGFAVLDVDYGGSTGYGRDYRRRLRKSWGIVDIDDVCAGAQYLVEQGLADGDRLCIDGGSAGGYTTLGALAFRDVFKAGCSLYGIGDLTALAGDTHKFESRYLDGLVGPYPEDEAIYKERSPIESVDTLSCPILLLQGEEDKVVPPNQAKMMHEALLKKGIPTCLKIYEGEQHGFRAAENIENAMDSELAFYGRVFGIDVPNAIEIQIDNM
jgi:dipeptidyl aminopeptidase/acylaminoacyl peptidase